MTLSDSPNEFQLDNAPSDCIQSVKFGDNNQHLIAASWDSTVRLYDIEKRGMRAKYSHTAPVLDCSFQVSNVDVFVYLRLTCLLLASRRTTVVCGAEASTTS